MRRAVDWALVPVSAGVITNVVMGTLAGTSLGAVGGWPWNTILAVAAVLGTAALKVRADSGG